MLGSIPHQKFCFYHLPTRGRAGIKLGDAWYVSNVSIIFYCSMLLYYLFWMFYMHLSAILYYFWDQHINLKPSANFCFLPILEFRRKGIPNGVQTEWNFSNDLSWTESKPEDLEMKSERQRGGHEVGGSAPTLVGPSWLHRPTSSSYIYLSTPKPSESTTKPYFHRRNLLYPRDPILGPFPELCRRGNRSRRASTNTIASPMMCE